MWQDEKILIVARRGKCVSAKQVHARVKDGLSFGVVDMQLESSAWGLIHLDSGLVAPSIFPTQKSAAKAAEMMEGLGDWGRGLKVWSHMGEKVPFYLEARQVVQVCGGKYIQDLEVFRQFHQDKPDGVARH